MSPLELFSEMKPSPTAFSTPQLGCLTDIPPLACPKLNSWSVPCSHQKQSNLPPPHFKNKTNKKKPKAEALLLLQASPSQKVATPSFTFLRSKPQIILNSCLFHIIHKQTCQLYFQNITPHRLKLEIRIYPETHPFNAIVLI